METNQITREIIDSAYKVHSTLGPGLLESAYRKCLVYELKKKGLFVEEEKPLPLIYDDIKLELGYRIDILVEKKIVVELKTVYFFNEVHFSQILTYPRLSDNNIGLLLNFYTRRLKDGIKRIIL